MKLIYLVLLFLGINDCYSRLFSRLPLSLSNTKLTSLQRVNNCDNNKFEHNTHDQHLSSNPTGSKSNTNNILNSMDESPVILTADASSKLNSQTKTEIVTIKNKQSYISYILNKIYNYTYKPKLMVKEITPTTSLRSIEQTRPNRGLKKLVYDLTNRQYKKNNAKFEYHPVLINIFNKLHTLTTNTVKVINKHKGKIRFIGKITIVTAIGKGFIHYHNNLLSLYLTILILSFICIYSYRYRSSKKSDKLV